MFRGVLQNSDVTFYSYCSCGAVTVYIGNESYSCKVKDKRIYFPDLDFRRFKHLRNPHTTYACDYCVNHYGLDLCSCGSGEKVGKCECGSNQPMQVVGEYDKVIAADAWLFGGK